MVVVLLLFLSVVVAGQHAHFAHPAGWHTKDDIERVRGYIASGERAGCSAATRTLANPLAACDLSASVLTLAPSNLLRARSPGREPWKTAAAYLMNDTSLTSSFTPSPAATVCRTCCNVSCCPPDNPHCGAAGSGGMERDGMASYYLMLRWIALKSLT